MTTRNINRRQFLENASLVAAATLLTPKLTWGAAHSIKNVGIQLFSVRDLMKADFDVTLANLANFGYKEIEFAGYYDRTPKQVRAVLGRNGLKSPSCHVDFDVLQGDKWLAQIESAKIIGQGYIVNPWIPEEKRLSNDDWKRAADVFNKAGEISKKAGIQLAYHNHFFEFFRVLDKVPYDILLENTDPNLVNMELDLCWITVGGGDPIKYFEKYPGRFPMVHVKDVKSLPTGAELAANAWWEVMGKLQTDVGTGMIKWKEILAKAEVAGAKHFFVEHDAPKDPLQFAKNSYEYLSKLTF